MVHFTLNSIPCGYRMTWIPARNSQAPPLRTSKMVMTGMQIQNPMWNQQYQGTYTPTGGKKNTYKKSSEISYLMHGCETPPWWWNLTRLHPPNKKLQNRKRSHERTRGLLFHSTLCIITLPGQWHPQLCLLLIRTEHQKLHRGPIFSWFKGIILQPRNQWRCYQTLRYYEIFYVIISGGRSGGIVPQLQIRWTNQNHPWRNGPPPTDHNHVELKLHCGNYHQQQGAVRIHKNHGYVILLSTR